MTESNVIRDKCGVFGILGTTRASELTYFGLYSLQHRGQESAGIVSSGNGTVHIYRGMGEVNEVFTQKRYIDQYLNQKLFEVNYLNNSYIDSHCESKVIDYLTTTISKYDLVLVSDFGHGFITSKIIKTIEEFSKKVAVNTQTNAANVGYNMITKYQNLNYVCLDELEVRRAAQEKFAPIEEVARTVSNTINSDYIMVTLGKKGSIAISRRKDMNRTPVFSTKVIDTVGAGDAFFAFTSPCIAQGMPLDLVSFIGNAVGALAVQIICNKKSIEKYELLEFINTILK